ncbi:NAD-dependent succinate-semialdehyde dehydrogenase [Mobilicoccus caccae]|uniref:Succinate-semialdehyde dehydrogenase [NADP(+)] n=1 Tax=Mobilicoccus caccae TaxID=1859295 RepID=A0ABQ6IWZ1_9MICO|nr:NAD-dependent succinate-semialdehyde dehydrogenase [Mobilicoccus caccae]GMA42086.1 succinate-semialdehyde dehydrogenase [NADP(+)] [Mobilicoccus caccae]
MSNDYRTENPATGEILEEFPTLDDAGVKSAIDRAGEAYTSWRTTDPAERAKLLAKVADIYDERAQELAEIIAREMGKPVKQGLGEIGIVSGIYRYYAEHGVDALTEEVLNAPGGESIVRRDPVGVLLGIMPWNFPYYQVARFAAPNLMLGNTILLKHAQICAKSALVMEEIFRDAGFPEGAYVNIFATNEQITDVIADPRVQGVSLTGSERAGAAVAETAGRNLKKCVLELGGSDAMIVLDSPDIARTVKVAAGARLSNAGQACNSPKRMLVAEDLYDEFVEGLTAAFEKTSTGDPLEDDTRMGPLSSKSALDTLLEQVQDAKDKGVTVRTGGDRVEGPGAFMQPTVLTAVTPEMRAYTEELFGPVAMVFKVSSAEEAIEFANSSPYGLSGSVWTQDAELGRSVADRLDVGMAYINEHGTTMAELPFGGVKRSGYGRELASYGMDEFANKKLIRTSGR